MVLNICRLCLTTKKDPLINIVNSTLKCSELTLIDCLYWIFGVEVNVCDPFSKLICSQCICIINFVGNFRETFQKNQTILQEKRDLFENQRISKASALLLFNDVGTFPEKNIDTSPEKNIDTSPEKNIDTPPEKNIDTSPENIGTSPQKNIGTSHEKNNGTSITKKNTNDVPFLRDQFEMVSQPIIVIPRLEESNIYREYQKIEDTLYKKLENIDKVDSKKTNTTTFASPVDEESNDPETSTNPANDNVVMVPIDKYGHFPSPSLILPRLEDTKFREEFDKVNDTTYKLIARKIDRNSDLMRPRIKRLNFINYYYRVRTSALQELIKGRSGSKNDLKIFKRPKMINDKSEPLFKINRENQVHVCKYCSEVCETIQLINYHYKTKHRQPAKDEINMIRRRTRRKKKRYKCIGMKRKTTSLTTKQTERLITDQPSNTRLKMSLKNKCLIPRMLLNRKGHKWFDANKLLNYDRNKHGSFPTISSAEEIRKNDVEYGKSDQKMDTQHKILLSTRFKGEEVENVPQPTEVEINLESIEHKEKIMHRNQRKCRELKTKMNILRNINRNQYKHEHDPTLHYKKSRENDVVCNKPDQNMENITQDEILLSASDKEQEVKNVSRPVEILDNAEIKENVMYNEVQSDQNLENTTEDEILLPTRDKEQEVENVPQPSDRKIILDNVELQEKVMDERQTESSDVPKRKINKLNNIMFDQVKSKNSPTLHDIKVSTEHDVLCDTPDPNMENTTDEILLSTIDEQQEVSQPADVEIILDNVEFNKEVMCKRQMRSEKLKRKIDKLKNINCDQVKHEHFPMLYDIKESRQSDLVYDTSDSNVGNTTEDEILLSTEYSGQEIENMPQSADVEIILNSAELKEKVMHKRQAEHCEQLKRKIVILQNINCGQIKHKYDPTINCVKESRENYVVYGTPEKQTESTIQDNILLSTKDKVQEVENVPQPAEVEIILDSVELKEKCMHKEQMEHPEQLNRKIDILQNINYGQIKRKQNPPINCIKESRENDVVCNTPEKQMESTTQDNILLSTKDKGQEVENVPQPAEVEIILDNAELKEKVMHKRITEHCEQLKRKIVILQNINCGQIKHKYDPTINCVKESRENYVVYGTPEKQTESTAQDNILLSTKDKVQEVENVPQPAEVGIILDSVKLKEKCMHKEQMKHPELNRKIDILQNINYGQIKHKQNPPINCIKESRENDVVCNTPEKQMESTTQDNILLSTKGKGQEVENVPQPVEVEIILDNTELKEKVMHKRITEHCEQLKRKIDKLRNINCGQIKRKHDPTMNYFKESEENDVVCDTPEKQMESITRDNILLSTKDKEQEVKNVPQPAEVEIILDSVELKEKCMLKEQMEHPEQLNRKIDILQNIDYGQIKRKQNPPINCIKESRENDVVCNTPEKQMESTTQDNILLSTKGKGQEVENVPQPVEVEIILDNAELKEKVMHKRITEHCEQLKRKIDKLRNINCGQIKRKHDPTMNYFKESEENDVVCDTPEKQMESITRDNILLSTKDKEQEVKNVPQPAEVEIILDSVAHKEKVMQKEQTELSEEWKRKINIRNSNCDQVDGKHSQRLYSVKKHRENNVCVKPDQQIKIGTQNKILLTTVDKKQGFKNVPQPGEIEIILDNVEHEEKVMSKGQTNHSKKLKRKIDILKNINCDQVKRKYFPTLHLVKESKENDIVCDTPEKKIGNTTQDKILLSTRDNAQEVRDVSQSTIVEIILDDVELNEHVISKVQTERPEQLKSKIEISRIINCDPDNNISTLYNFKESRKNDVICDIPDLEMRNTTQDEILLSTRDKKQGVKDVPQPAEVEIMLDSVNLKEKVIQKKQTEHSEQLKRKIDILKNVNCEQVEHKHFRALHCVKESRKTDVVCDTPDQKMDNTTQGKILLSTRDKSQEIRNLPQPAEVEIILDSVELKEKVMHTGAMEQSELLKRKIDTLKKINCNPVKRKHFSTFNNVKETRKSDVVCDTPDLQIENTTQDNILASPRNKWPEVKDVSQPADVEIILDSVELKEKVMHKEQTEHFELKRKIDMLKDINCDQVKQDHFPTLNSVKKPRINNIGWDTQDTPIESIPQDKFSLSARDKEQKIENIPGPAENERILDNVPLEEKVLHKRQKEHGELQRKMNILKNIVLIIQPSNSSQRCKENKNESYGGPPNLISDDLCTYSRRSTVESNAINNGISGGGNQKININANDKLFLQRNKEQFDTVVRLNKNLSYVDSTCLRNEHGDIFEGEHVQQLDTKLKCRKLRTEICHRKQVKLQENRDLFEKRLSEASVSLSSSDVGTSFESNVDTRENMGCVALARDQLQMVSRPIVTPKLKKSKVYRKNKKINATFGKKIENISKDKEKKEFTKPRNLTNPVKGTIGIFPIDIYRQLLSPSLSVPRLEDTKFLEEFEKISDTTYKQRSKPNHNPGLMEYVIERFHFMEDHTYSLPPPLDQLCKNRNEVIKRLNISKPSKRVKDKCESLLKIENGVFVCKYCSKSFETVQKISSHYKIDHEQLREDEINEIKGRKCQKRKGYNRSRRKPSTTNETKQLITDLTTELISLKISARDEYLTPNLFLNGIRQNWFSKGNQSKRDNFSIKSDHFPNLMFVNENKGDNLAYRKVVEEKGTTMRDESLSTGDKQQDIQNVPEPNGTKITLDIVECKERVGHEEHMEHHRELEKKVNRLDDVLIPNLSQQCEEEKN